MSDPLFISRGRLSYRRYRGYSRPYIVHQLVADLFPDGERQHLYRVTARAPGEADVLVLSVIPPSDQSPRRPWGETAEIDTKPFNPAFKPGSSLDFEIRINATRVVTCPNGSKKRRDVWDAVFEADRNDPRTPHDVYRSYLERKLLGVAGLHDARVTERGFIRARRAGRERPIRFVATNVVGSVQIDDPEGFLRLVGKGIGRAKGFGCGLLCLSKPGTVLARRTVFREIG